MFDHFFRSILGTEILLFAAVLAMLGFFGLLLKKLWREKPPLLALGAILLIGLALRIYWIYLTQPAPQSDFLVYWNYANRFFHGNLAYDILDRHPGIMLLYTYTFWLLGPSMLSGWVLNVLFSVIFLLTVYQFTRELFGLRAGLIAMGISAIFPQYVTYGALLASEIPAVTLMLLVIWGALNSRFVEKHRLLYWAALGLLLYGAIIVRSTSILLMGLIPLAMLFTRREHLKSALSGCRVMIVTATLLLSTWIAHQYVLTGIPKLFFGEQVWLAFATQYEHGGSVSSSSELPYYDKLKAANDGTIQGELRTYKIMGEESYKIIRQDPIRYLLSGFTRMKQIVWNAKTGVIWSIQASSIFHPDGKTVRHLGEISTIAWRVVLVLSLLSLFCLFQPASLVSREGQLITWTFLGVWLVFHYLISVASERYGFQIMPLIIMLASGGMIALVERLSRKPVSANTEDLTSRPS